MEFKRERNDRSGRPNRSVSRSRSRERNQRDRERDRDRDRNDRRDHRRDERRVDEVKSRERDRERDRDNARDRERDRERDRIRDRERDRERDNERDVERNKSKAVNDDARRSTKGGGEGHGTSSETSQDVQIRISEQDNEEYREKELQALQDFLEAQEEEEDEEAKAERLALERKKRREEILKKHSSAPEASSASAATKLIPAHLTVAVQAASSGAVDAEPVADEGADVEAARKKVDAADLGAGSDAEGNSPVPTTPARMQHHLSAVEDEEELVARLAAEKAALELAAAQEKKISLSFDMFSASPSDFEGLGADNGQVGRRALREALLDGEENPHLQSNWDDGEGYYKARIGEILQDRYKTLGVVGKGVFSTVVKCFDLRRSAAPSTTSGVTAAAADSTGAAKSENFAVAIKMIRNNDTMRKAADKEKAILSLIAERDPHDKKHCVRLLEHFDFRGHIALVFEYQQMNLRETLNKFGKDVGINIGAIRLYARQLFTALRHLSELAVVHADIKLDNILCSGDLKQVKLCDFGSAFWETDLDNDPTPYLVSRFYRAPEIILGQQYGKSIDLWAVGVSLYELFTGHVMFPGRTNNEMLKLMMNFKGRFSNKQLRQHLRQYELLNMDSHFDSDLRFKQYEVDPVSGKPLLRVVDITGPVKDLTAILRSAKAGADDPRLVNHLIHLIDQCICLDPTKRITVSDALKHPLFTSK